MACDYSLHFNHAFLMSKFKGGGVLETLEDLLEYRKNQSSIAICSTCTKQNAISRNRHVSLRLKRETPIFNCHNDNIFLAKKVANLDLKKSLEKIPWLQCQFFVPTAKNYRFGFTSR